MRQRDSGAPFFMWTSFEAPHPPFDPPESYARLYDGRAIPKPVTGEWVGEGEPAWVSARKLICKLDRLDDDVIAAARKHYYAMITNIDYALGRLFGELKSQGLWDDTIIVFTSDHGEMLGDHGLFHKSCFYEPSARVPLIVKPARSAELPLQAGSVCDRPVMLAGLYPTFMDMTGCSSGSDEADRDGRSLIGAMSAGDSRILYGYINDQGGMYMVTDEAWKYLYFALDGREQLFQLKEDPRETSDLSTSAAELHQQRLKAFRSLFATRFADHPIVGPGGLKLGEIACGAALEDWQLRRQNPFAWRGPMRYGGHW